MGILITWSAPPDDAEWDKFIIKRALSQSGAYTTIATINSKSNDTWVISYWDEDGSSNHWYKIQPYNSITGIYGSETFPMRAESLTTNYCLISDIEAFLHNTFGGSTNPSIYDVIKLIKNKEDEIDYITGHAWRLRYSGTTTGEDDEAKYEYYDIPPYNHYRTQTGIAINLKHRKIRDIFALEIWDGNQYVDYITNKTEGRTGNYWVDYENGIVYLMDVIYSGTISGLRIKYTYGEEYVPGDIKEACVLLVCSDLAMNDDRSLIFPKGTDNVPLTSKYMEWRKRAYELIYRRAEM
ncbi:MAG: hypothetical protein QXL51_00995 [Candidatus Aenigmatarchaeota archaeon]